MKTDQYLIDFYNQYDEDSRLAPRHGSVEFLTTMRYIEKYIRPGHRVLEVGAGTGRYSHALAGRGYAVDAVELVEHNIEIFRQNTRPGEPVTITQGNAMDLSAFPDDAYDIVLLLGPLYHLYNAEDKRRALGEAIRVTKPGGLVFAAYVISDSCLLDEGFRRGNISVAGYIETGLIDPVTFAARSQPKDLFELVRKEDVDELMSVFPVTRLHYVASDGCALLLREAVDGMDGETFELFMNYHLPPVSARICLGSPATRWTYSENRQKMLDPPVAGGFIFLIAGNAPDRGSREVALHAMFPQITVKITAAPSFRCAVGGIEMKQEQNLTEGPVLKTLLAFTVPFIIANVIQALYGAVDLFVIGRYCTPESVAAVSTGTQVTQIITSMITGLTLGSTILVGKYTGMNAKEEVKKTIGTTLSVFALAALALTAAMLLFATPILELLKTPQQSFALARQYVVICSCGIFFICGYNAISAILRGYGDSRRPMMFIALSCALNVAGDVILVKYAGLGVAGVALATIGSQAISMICAIVYLNRSRFIFTFTLSNLRIDSRKVRELAAVGIPISLQECMVRLSFLYLTSVTNRLGVYAAAAVGIASKYDVFAMLPATSTANALAAVTAQNYGAGKPERARASLFAGLGFAVAASSLFWLWAQFSPETMIGMFTRDGAIINEGIPFFRSCSYDYLAVSFVFCLNGYLNGRSKTIFTMISCCFGALALRMPLIWLVYTYWPDNLLRIGSIAPAVSGFMAVYTLIYVVISIRRERGEADGRRGVGGVREKKRLSGI